MRALAGLLIAVALLGGCAEKAQTAGGKTAGGKKIDAKAYTGTGVAGFTAPGWKAGDAASWEQQLRARNQAQNEYARTR